MPTRLARPCRKMWCRNLTTDRTGYCAECRPVMHRNYAQTRGDDAEQKFYRSSAWRKYSEQYRQQHPICERCGRKPVALVHHIIPIKEGGSYWDTNNHEGVCNSCQAKSHR